jgi:hypothetical protein
MAKGEGVGVSRRRDAERCRLDAATRERGLGDELRLGVDNESNGISHHRREDRF